MSDTTKRADIDEMLYSLAEGAETDEEYFIAVCHLMEEVDSIKPADIARALGKNDPRGVYYWFEQPERGADHLTEILEGWNIIRKQNGEPLIDMKFEHLDALHCYRDKVRKAIQASLKKIIEDLDTADMRTLENIAMDMYQRKHKYPSFYEQENLTNGCRYERRDGELRCVQYGYRWESDDILRGTSADRDAIERAHTKAEALADSVVSTDPEYPYGGSWESFEEHQHDDARVWRVLMWRGWLVGRPADMPMTPEVRQLLAILELEAPEAEPSAIDLANAEPSSTLFSELSSWTPIAQDVIDPMQ